MAFGALCGFLFLRNQGNTLEVSEACRSLTEPSVLGINLVYAV